MASTDDYIAAGLYDPVEHANNGRLDLLNWLSDNGFTIEEMRVGLATDTLGAIAGDRRLVSGVFLDRVQALELSGLSEADFDMFAKAIGFVSIDRGLPDGVESTEAEAKALATFGAVSSMFSPAETESLVRVIGSSMSRIAEAAVSLFLMDVESPMLNAKSSELDLALKIHEAVGLLDGFTEVLDPILRRHILQATVRSREATIDYTERFQYRYAIGFVDLVGFTQISGQMSARELATFIRDFEGRAHDVVTSAGATVVKLIGDEIMFVATDPEAACHAGRALMAGFGDEHTHVLPRGGLAYGNVMLRGGDYYGSVVNLAARLCDIAVPQELLVTEAVASTSSHLEFEPAGRRVMKGFDDPIAVYSLPMTTAH